MISLGMVVSIVITLLVAGCVFGLLFFLINYVGSQFGGAEPFVKVARIVLMVLAILFLIGMLISFSGAAPSGPIFRP